MDIQLTPENEQFINEQLAQGSYDGPDALLNAGLELLRRRNEVLSKVQRGCQQLAEGDFTDYTREELRERFEELKRRATRSANRDATHP